VVPGRTRPLNHLLRSLSHFLRSLSHFLRSLSHFLRSLSHFLRSLSLSKGVPLPGPEPFAARFASSASVL